MRISFAVLLLAGLAGCNNEIYVRDGVTDGDTFYLAPAAWANGDPALQSWVTYSLMKSSCQLSLGGPNPARQSSFGCEFTARRHLVEQWRERPAGATDSYLDELEHVADAGYLDEYVAHYFAHSHWHVPGEADVPAFRDWQRNNLPRHRPETRLIGSWNYAN